MAMPTWATSTPVTTKPTKVVGKYAAQNKRPVPVNNWLPTQSTYNNDK